MEWSRCCRWCPKVALARRDAMTIAVASAISASRQGVSWMTKTRFSVSQSVVRGAPTSLAEQSLVVAIPRGGFRVRQLSVKDIVGLTEARVAIESIALRLA